MEYWGIGKRRDQDEKERICNAGGPSGGVAEIDYTRPIIQLWAIFRPWMIGGILYPRGKREVVLW